ncbi:alpha-D-ribose 1-methylphosphonate 5-triphosphate synthase subunit PhnL [Halanaerobium congolense]|jgi:alpha-D-ribose 1-methylphosphonate 5-triphosphate synthase subunit PhnL|uniref:Alpha-D-ribose 1-methylphosphonate 5-triphosphate synthase subunit PhnL n=1 Tax=Halanaerobium congolense TaxID=54121 RepID=A0A318E5R2_9FIRM|nr:ATP-binding cassette domain-containing protein [Halanaerobium congolense]PXV65565.1 alpha-D-ribose 1-methylphosphonate 5-triphosphate synthase subunit PhnL [Halanaerobium congolense]
MKHILEVNNLVKNFELKLLNNKIIRGCENVNFRLEKGDFLGIYGPSGTGKSTVMKCIYRTYLPTSGQIIYNSDALGAVDLAEADEQDIIKLRDNEIKYLTQFLQIIPRVSAQDIVAEELIKKGFNYDTSVKRAHDLFRRLDIPEELWDAYPATFSGGEKQRINIAKSVISKPKLLLLDEPTASLNKQLKKKVLGLLKELKQEGTTMIGIFHNLEFMRNIAEHELMMPDSIVKAVS